MPAGGEAIRKSIRSPTSGSVALSVIEKASPGKKVKLFPNPSVHSAAVGTCTLTTLSVKEVLSLALSVIEYRFVMVPCGVPETIPVADILSPGGNPVAENVSVRPMGLEAN